MRVSNQIDAAGCDHHAASLCEEEGFTVPVNAIRKTFNLIF